MKLRKIFFTSILLLSVSVLFPSRTLAHGDEAMSQEELKGGFLSVGPYEFLLEGAGQTPMLGKAHTLTVRVYDSRARRLLKGGRVLMDVKLPQIDLDAVKAQKKNQAPTHSGRFMLNSPLSWTPEGKVDLSGFSPGRETPEGGHYQLTFTPEIKGLHLLKVALLRDNAEPVVAQFVFAVMPSHGLNWTLISVLSAFIFAFAVSAYALGVRASGRALSLKDYNFLDIGWVDRLFRSRFFQPAFQLPCLAIFLAVILLGFLDTQDAGRNFATKLTWTIWWAGIIFTFVLVGRVWCLMCPFGALTEWMSRLFKPARKFPAVLRNLWLANITFFLLTWADGYFGIVSSPRATAWLIAIIFGAALVIGILYPRRTFCRYLCPIGGLISIYSMFSAVELRAKSQEACVQGKGKDCYVGNERGYGCPMFEFPQRMQTNNYCNFCGECIKTCPERNLTLRLRPFGRDLWTTVKAHADEAFLAVGLVGVTVVATGHMLVGWHEFLDLLARAIPWAWLGIREHATIEGIMYSFVFFLFSLGVVPLLMLAASWGSSRLARGHSLSTWSTFKVFAYMFIPVGLSMHLSHNLLHLLAEGQKIVPVTQKTLNIFTPLWTGTPNWELGPIVELPAIYWLQMTFLMVFFIYSIYTGFRLALRHYGEGSLALRALSPMLVLSLLFMLLNVFLLTQGMNPRHVH